MKGHRRGTESRAMILQGQERRSVSWNSTSARGGSITDSTTLFVVSRHGGVHRRCRASLIAKPTEHDVTAAWVCMCVYVCPCLRLCVLHMCCLRRLCAWLRRLGGSTKRSLESNQSKEDRPWCGYAVLRREAERGLRFQAGTVKQKHLW